MADNDPPGGPTGTPPGEPGGAGRMRFQDENTTPREPTLAERKARERAMRRAEEERSRQLVEQQRTRNRRRRVLIGAGVSVGVVALIAAAYVVAQPDEEIQAQCVDEAGVIVDDSNCVTPAADSHYGAGGVGFFPIFIGSGGRQYHYNYGGTGSVGERVSGGTTTVPKDGVRVRTSSGRVSTVDSGRSARSADTGSSAGTSKSGVTRGGLGSSSRSSSSGS